MSIFGININSDIADTFNDYLIGVNDLDIEDIRGFWTILSPLANHLNTEQFKTFTRDLQVKDWESAFRHFTPMVTEFELADIERMFS